MNRISLEVGAKAAVSLGVSGKQAVSLGVGRASGTSSYPALANKPSIEGHTLLGDSTLPQIGVGTIAPQDIDTIIYG